MDARNFFDGAEKSKLRLNQFGANIGGPIVKDKLFFFGSFEALRQRAGLNVLETVPSASARARAVPEIAPLLSGFPMGFEPPATRTLIWRSESRSRGSTRLISTAASITTSRRPNASMSAI